MLGWLFTNLLALLGLAVGWLNPFWGLMVYYAFAILRPTDLWFWAWDRFNPPRFSYYVALSVLLGWFLRGFGSFRGLHAARIALFGLGLFIASGLLATFTQAIDWAYSWQYLYPILTVGLMMLVGLSLVRSPRAIAIFAWVLTACLGYLAWVFNSQYYFQGYNRVFLRGFGGIDNNGTAMIFVMAVPLSFFMGIHSRPWWLKVLCFFAVLLQIHVVLFSFSRGGQLGLCLVGAMIFLLALVALPRKGLTLLVALVFVLAALRLAGPQVRQEFWSIFVDPEQRDASARSRLETWAAAWQCIRDHPLGVGPRGFNLVSHHYGLPFNKSVHNLFLQTAADYGVAGALGLATFYLATVFRCCRLAFHPVARRLHWPQYYAQMTVIALVGMLVCSMFIGMESVELGYWIAMLGLATAAYVDRIARIENQAVPPVLPELERVPLDEQPPTP